MLPELKSIARGLWLLRNPLLVRWLGEQLSGRRLTQQVLAGNPGCFIDDDVAIVGWRHEHLALGEGVRVEKGSVLAFGDPLNGWGRLAVGRNTWIGEYNNFRLAEGAHITIGSDCLVSQFCSLVASNHDTRGRGLMASLPPDPRKKGVTVGDNVWLGAGCVLLPGSEIGHGAVLGAGSIVTGTVPPFEIWAGHPARKVGARE